MFGIKTNYKYLSIQLVVIMLCIIAGLFVKPLLFVPFAVSVYAIVRNKDNYVFCQLFFILPFSMIYKLSPASSSFYSYIILFYALYVTVFKQIRMNNFLLIAFYLLFGTLNSLEIWLKFLSGLILLTYFVENNSRRNIIEYVVCFAWGLILSSVVGLYKQEWFILGQYFDGFNEEIIGGELIARFSALYNDPNYYSISVIIAVYFLADFFVRGYLNRIFVFVPILILIYFGFLTYSKMYMLSILLVLVVQMKGYIQNSKYKVYAIIFVPVSFIIMIWKFVSSDYFTQFLTRVDTDDISSNRFIIWQHYLGYLADHIITLIFGVGFADGFYKGTAPHNSYIEGIYFLGIIGSVIYIFTIISILNSTSLIKRRSVNNYLVVYIFMVMIGTLGVLTFNDIWMYYMLIWASLNSDYKKKLSD